MARAMCSFGGCPKAAVAEVDGRQLCNTHYPRPTPCANWLRDLFLASNGRIPVQAMLAHRQRFKSVYPMDESLRTLRRLEREQYLTTKKNPAGEMEHFWLFGDFESRECPECGADFVGNDPHAEGCTLDPETIDAERLRQTLLAMAHKLGGS